LDVAFPPPTYAEGLLVWQESIDLLVPFDSLSPYISFSRIFFPILSALRTAVCLSECPHNPWRIQHGALFGRLELFIERIASLIDITRTLISFNKLAKVSSEGESRGKAQALEIVIVFPAPLA